MYFAYCERCLKQPNIKTEGSFYDFRFDYPVCISCVEEYSLEPESECDHIYSIDSAGQGTCMTCGEEQF